MLEPSAFVVITDREGNVVETHPAATCHEVLQNQVVYLDNIKRGNGPHVAWKWGGGSFSFVTFDPKAERHSMCQKDSSHHNMVTMDTQRFECACSSYQHSFRVTLDPEEGDIFLTMGLVTWLPWYNRLYFALKYVFSPGESKFGPYDEVVLRREDCEKIRDIITSSEKIRKEKTK